MRSRWYLRSVERRWKTNWFVRGRKRGSWKMKKKEQRVGVRDRISETAAKMGMETGQVSIWEKSCGN